MANRTVQDVHSIHDTNPQYLLEIIRYWKQECFGLTAELVVEKATELRNAMY
uniref:Uncharacterized protein n=1 Tax=Aotus nancymaae TaxID=37293 RepID=A0A2K5DPS0_AOTNA